MCTTAVSDDEQAFRELRKVVDLVKALANYINSSKYENREINFSAETMPRILVFGNPLLDVTVQIEDDELLKKYCLDPNGQKEVSFEKLSKLIGDAKARYGELLEFSHVNVPLYRLNNSFLLDDAYVHPSR